MATINQTENWDSVMCVMCTDCRLGHCKVCTDWDSVTSNWRLTILTDDSGTRSHNFRHSSHCPTCCCTQCIYCSFGRLILISPRTFNLEPKDRKSGANCGVHVNHTKRKIELNNQHFYALLASNGHRELLVKKDDWQGRLNALKCCQIILQECGEISIRVESSTAYHSCSNSKSRGTIYISYWNTKTSPWANQLKDRSGNIVNATLNLPF